MSENTRAHLEGMTVADFREHIRQIQKDPPRPKGPCVRTPGKRPPETRYTREQDAAAIKRVYGRTTTEEQLEQAKRESKDQGYKPTPTKPEGE